VLRVAQKVLGADLSVTFHCLTLTETLHWLGAQMEAKPIHFLNKTLQDFDAS
jgi:hypothetical protein